jgi:hypothetical protein
MSLIFAVDSDKRQSAILASLLRSHVNADLVQSGSATEGLGILQGRIPDLILTSPLLSPRDEAALANHLRELGDGAAHVHTLTIPVIEAPAQGSKKSQGLLGGLRREKDSKAGGCDPAVFAREVALYLDRAVERRMTAGNAAAPAAHIALIDAQPAPSPAIESVPVPAPDVVTLAAAIPEDSADSALTLEQVLKLVGRNEEAPPAPPLATTVRQPDAAEAAGLSAQELAELSAPLPKGRAPDAIRAPEAPVPIVEIDTCDEVQFLENQFAATPVEPVEFDSPQDFSASDVVATPAALDSWPAPAAESSTPSWPWMDDLAAAPLADVLLEACAQAAARLPEPIPEPEPEPPPPLLLDLESLELIGAAAHQAGLDAFGSAGEPAVVADPAEEAEQKEESRAVRRVRERPPRTARKPKKTAPRPAQDEWGMYDPAQCGPAALFGDEDDDASEEDPEPRPRRGDVVY